jgi:LPXTG-motif cell wall-anchored protein
MVPALAFGQVSGDVSQTQNGTNSASGTNINQSVTNQNCVAGRDCTQSAVTNQNSGATAHVARRAGVRRAHRHIRLARTGSDLSSLFLVGGLASLGGLALLVGVRRRVGRDLA